MSDVVIKVENLSKKYILSHQSQEKFTALRDVMANGVRNLGRNSLNPMVGVIDGFRWAILGGAATINWPSFMLSNGLVLLSLVTGIWYFRRTEKTFADVI